MRISIGQLAPSTDKTDNLAAIAEQAAKAAGEGASLIVFPEMSMFFKHGLDDAFAANAELVPGPFTRALDGIAKTSGIGIVAGILETVPGDRRPANTLYVTSKNGEAIGTYRKVHLYDAFGLRESDIICPSPSLEPVVFELDGLTFGLLTCYDLRFPESARVLVDRGADVLVLPSAWTPGVRKENHWETLVRARAIENTGLRHRRKPGPSTVHWRQSRRGSNGRCPGRAGRTDRAGNRRNPQRTHRCCAQRQPLSRKPPLPG